MRENIYHEANSRYCLTLDHDAENDKYIVKLEESINGEPDHYPLVFTFSNLESAEEEYFNTKKYFF